MKLKDLIKKLQSKPQQNEEVESLVGTLEDQRDQLQAELSQCIDKLGLQERAAKTWSESAQAAYKRTDEARAELSRVREELEFLYAGYERREYHAMCNRIWQLVEPRDGLPCDVILAEQLTTERAEHAKVKAELAAIRDVVQPMPGQTIVGAISADRAALTAEPQAHSLTRQRADQEEIAEAKYAKELQLERTAHAATKRERDDMQTIAETRFKHAEKLNQTNGELTAQLDQARLEVEAQKEISLQLNEDKRAEFHRAERAESSLAALEQDGLNAFWKAQAAWSQATFGLDSERGPIGPLKHLAKEAAEAQKDPTDLMEFVDCLFLTFDATRRAGFTFDQLCEAAWKKLEINKARQWTKPTKGDEAVEHDRSKDTHHTTSSAVEGEKSL